LRVPAGHRAAHMNVENYRIVIIGSGEGGKVPCLAFSTIRTTNGSCERRWVGGFLPECQLSFPARTKSGALKSRISCITQPDLELPLAAVSTDIGGGSKRKREMVEGLIATH